MRDTIRVVPYFDQLDAIALLAGVELRDAFDAAGIPSSTYYRSLHGADLRVETANRVASVLREHIKRDRKHEANGTAACRAVEAVVD